MASDTLIPSWTIPVPAKEACSHDLQQALSAWLLSYMKYHRKPNFCVITSVSASRDSIQEFASGLRKALAGSAILYVDYEPPKNRLPQVIAFEYSTTWPADLQRQTLTIIPPTPKLFSVAGHQDAWFVDILKDNETGRALCDIQLPESTIIPELLNGPCPPKYEHHRVPRFGDGVDSINFHCSPKTGTIHFYVPTPEEVLEEILREHGYEIVHDEKRASYLPVIERFGGLQMAASAMSGQSGEVLEILRARRPRTAVERTKLNDDQHQLILQAQEDAITPDQIKGWGKLGKGRLRDSHLLEQSDIMFARQSDRVKRIGMARFRRYAQSKIPKEMTLQALLEHWADNSIIKRKWEIGPCSTCKRRSFVDRIDFRKPPRCQHCGKRVPFEKHTKIAYSLEPAVRHSFNEGLPTIALTGRFLRNMTIRGFFWLPGVKYRRDDIRGDIDILACCDGHLVFGECKKLAETPHDASSWNKTTDQFLKLAPLASQCGGALVVLATMADSFPNDVQDRIRNELADKIPFLLLCKTDMEKGYRPTQPDSNVPSLGLHDLIPTGFPELPIERTPGQRQIDYGWAMFTKGPKVHPKSEDPSVDPINDSGTTQKDCSQGDVK
ncbi:MAG: hypothetical protein JW829_15340 [Pirellulales bacterium]|nr:hypothetical protein [Pirellulales bacterium]